MTKMNQRSTPFKILRSCRDVLKRPQITGELLSEGMWGETSKTCSECRAFLPAQVRQMLAWVTNDVGHLSLCWGGVERTRRRHVPRQPMPWNARPGGAHALHAVQLLRRRRWRRCCPIVMHNGWSYEEEWDVVFFYSNSVLPFRKVAPIVQKYKSLDLIPLNYC